MRPDTKLGAYTVSIAVLVAISWIAVRFGSVEELDFSWIVSLRVPRVLLGLAVGMGLAISGAILQALFYNPLCEPYILGISSGGALGAIAGSWLMGFLGFSAFLQFGASTSFAFVGSLLFTGILYLFSLHRRISTTGFLLTGVMLGFFGSSLVSLWMALTDPNGIQTAVYWLLGHLGGVSLDRALVVGSLILALSLVIWTRSSKLDALLLGEEQATSLGVDVLRLRRNLVLLVSLIVALCVSHAGMIGFVGLIVPHLVRQAHGSLHRHLIPLCGIWGGSLLIAADLLSRVALRPYELPVGVVTSLIGAPLFLWIILRKGVLAGDSAS